MIGEVVAAVFHNNVPDAVVDNVDVPLQLFTTFTVGVDGVVLIVKCNVTTLSHPPALVPVHVAVLLDAVYVVPCQILLLHALIVSIDEVGVQRYLFEAQETPILFTARIIIELVPAAKPVIVKGLTVAAGDKAVQVLPSFVEYS